MGVGAAPAPAPASLRTHAWSLPPLRVTGPQRLNYIRVACHCGRAPPAAAAKAGAAATHKRLSTLGYLRALLSKADTVLFFVLVMVMGVCKATIDTFLFLYLQNDLGASR